MSEAIRTEALAKSLLRGSGEPVKENEGPPWRTPPEDCFGVARHPPTIGGKLQGNFLQWTYPDSPLDSS